MSVAQKHGLGILPKAIRTAAWATIGLLVIFCLFLGINAGGGASSAFAATPDTSAAISATTTTDGTSDSLASSTPTTPTAPTNTSGASVATGATGQDVSILFTHDMHSHFDPERYMLDGQVAERGGLARLKTAIDNAEVSSPDSFLLDAGDFSMGTSYQTIFSSEAAELRIMGQMGYDATTLGNHEFDYRTQGLTDMLNAAVDSGDKLPALTADNIDWDATLADPALQADGQALENALARYGNADYVIIDRGGVKMAVFGIIGKSAIADAPLAGVDFKDPIETAKAMVAKIKAEANPDIIVCLSHSGTNPDPSKSEDELLAKAVPDIDVIISGHTHTVLEQPIVVGHTYIVSCGSYTDYLGQITLTRAGDRWQMGSYQLTPIDQGLALDQATETAILGFRSLVDERYFSKFGYQSDEVLANSPFSFTPIDQFGINQGEDTLGNLITDSYIYAVQKAEGSAYQKVDVAIVPNGIIRGSFAQGNITVADAYNVLSLGIGPDNVPGYPLVSIYLTGKELKTAAEVDISVSP
ncbi:MAG: bifunctional metallophosphatase/5'-nucleotidase, partial [Coriobacteriia bacterium]|nr:bifunctional metallophosphatase/5'-nucleotidase [Coriobacteriia bacterium]